MAATIAAAYTATGTRLSAVSTAPHPAAPVASPAARGSAAVVTASPAAVVAAAVITAAAAAVEPSHSRAATSPSAATSPTACSSGRTATHDAAESPRDARHAADVRA